MKDQTDVGISGALPPALASSIFPMLRLCDTPCGDVRPSATPGRGGQLFHVPQPASLQDDLGLLYTPAVL